MSTLVFPTADYPLALPPAKFTNQEYLAMVDAGLLEGKKVELIDGVIVAMSPAGIPHNYFLMNLNRLFAPLWDRALVSIQGTLPIGDGQVFDPDFMLLRLRTDGYKHEYPAAQDVQLLIEAADSSMTRDRKHKLPVYARAGIQDYWIADLGNQVLLVNREPAGEVYKSALMLEFDAVISPLAAPDFSLTVRQMFE
jgi:Uma2 family endonuclease